jgi:GH25 family lysozyme M1 (1,4-beta-N-acetylmuramidase)
MNVNNEQQENISKLLDEKLSIDKEELSVQLENVYISIVDLNSIECDKNTNRLFETIIQKFEFGLRNLEKSGESAENINYYKKKLRNAKIKRFLKNFFNF